MNLEEFKECLGKYSTDIDTWPSEEKVIAQAGLREYHDFKDALRIETEFEELLNLRKFEKPAQDLAERIISVSKNNIKTKSRPIMSILGDSFKFFHIPKPAYALITIFVFGISMGLLFNDPVIDENEEFTVSELNFYEGDYYEQ